MDHTHDDNAVTKDALVLALKRQMFCAIALPMATENLTKVAIGEALVINMLDEHTEPKIMALAHETLAKIYENFQFDELATMLRTPLDPTQAFVCINAFDLPQVFIVDRPVRLTTTVVADA